MSLYLSPFGIDAARLRAVAAELEFPGKKVAMGPGVAGWLWVDDEPERYGPATDATTGVRVVTSGRLVWSELEWARAARLGYDGGLANRLVIERYLEGGAATVAPYNGAAVITLYDPRDETVHIWTDQFGYHPCFLYRGERADRCIVTTFPDALLVDPAVDITFDSISMAEFVRAWRATPPNTYFSEVKHAGAATHISVSLTSGRILREEYWKPFDTEFFPSINAAAEELSAAVGQAIIERTAIATRPLFFISGGSDSRALLFCAADRKKVIGVNLYEREALETHVAAKLCETAGCEFLSLQRDSDYYPRLLGDIVRWSGAMWSVEDSHYLGFADRLTKFNPDLVMTACTTDWLFKGYGLEKKPVELLGRNLPLFAYTNERIDGFLPNIPLSAKPELESAINDRMSRWFEGCPRQVVTPHDRLVVEDRRVRPTAYTVSVSGSMMYRTFPYDNFLADSRIAHCYSRTHPDWKLNKELWGKVVARLCVGAHQLVDANFGWKVDASVVDKLFVFSRGWIERRIRGREPSTDNRPQSSGSWPDFGWYVVHSPTVSYIWDSATPEERDWMCSICTSDPWQIPLATWSRDAPLFFRLLSLLCFWRETAQRRKRANLPALSHKTIDSIS